MKSLLFLFSGWVLLTAGDILFKYWIERSEPYLSSLYAAGLALYMLGMLLLIESFKTTHIAIASVIFVIANAVTLTLVSWLYFGEKLSPLQMVALLCACISVAALEFSLK